MILKYFLSWFFSVGEFLEHKNLKTTEPEPEPKTYLLTTTQYGDFEHSSKYVTRCCQSALPQFYLFAIVENNSTKRGANKTENTVSCKTHEHVNA